ncbi:hypothetical protein GCM10009755_27580 [Brevibacterium samyangense]|uniref:Uncharacterized protein n=1 Tax=Brevibacterium samyangense TaxID=366888 RepID=A0ABN2TN10_9MICO
MRFGDMAVDRRERDGQGLAFVVRGNDEESEHRTSLEDGTPAKDERQGAGHSGPTAAGRPVPWHTFGQKMDPAPRPPSDLVAATAARAVWESPENR